MSKLGFKPIDAPHRHLLIDGDVFAFTAASAVQKIHIDTFGIAQPFAHSQEGEGVISNMILSVKELLNADSIEVVLTSSTNWRHSVYPEYKGGRKEPFPGAYRPLLLGHLKQYLRDNFGAYDVEGLEADDVLGIKSTETGHGQERIIVSRDKDFKTIPGKYHRMGDLDLNRNPVILESTQWEATRFHLYQTLKGDAVDGYPGCPQMGDTRAEEFLKSPTLLRPQKGVITVGKNKGMETTKWVAEPTRDYWAGIVSHYQKGGQGEAEALCNARLANILQADQYDWETKELTLWTPERIRGI